MYKYYVGGLYIVGICTEYFVPALESKKGKEF